ncbi:hypothetical protein [Bosea sp. (in: a-proteobacteria)]|jgi:hypothetical protein|uniref:hypothetical protein n=1 Tax=Bosea sp. (in: a-proteobacteria) TaxID=1871050 RepID=UPI002DDCF29E|nr:hypothetical protein [Bosea sp. (in: a-proteobacteria)]
MLSKIQKSVYYQINTKSPAPEREAVGGEASCCGSICCRMSAAAALHSPKGPMAVVNAAFCPVSAHPGRWVPARSELTESCDLVSSTARASDRSAAVLPATERIDSHESSFQNHARSKMQDEKH